MINSCGWTALMYAAHYGHFNVCRTLIHHNCQVDLREPKEGRTALMLAACNGHTRCIEILLKFGRADLLATDFNGHDAAYYAECSGHGNNKMIKGLLMITPSNDSRTIQRPKPYSIGAQKKFPKIKLFEPLNTDAKPFIPQSLVATQERPQDLARNSYSQFWMSSRSFDLSNQFPAHSTHALFEQQNESLSASTCSLTSNYMMANENIDKNQSLLGKKSLPLPNSLYDFLARIGLEQYGQLFEENGIDMLTLLTLNDDDFVSIGIKLYGHRKKLELAQARYHESMEIRDTHERLFADWLLNERLTLMKKIKKLEELLSHRY